MNRNDKSPGGWEQQGSKRTAQEICPQCGKPLYDCSCNCLERWEDEGGATLVLEEAEAQ